MRELRKATADERDSDALRLVDELLVLEGLSDETRVERALSLLDAGRFEAALVALEDAAFQGGDRRLAITARANALFELGRLDAAESALRDALRIAPSSARWTMLGALLVRLGRDEEARDCFSSAVAIDPSNDEAISGLALCVGEGDPNHAIGLIERAIRVDPENATYRRELGWFCLQAGRIDEAERALAAALHLDPSDIWAHIYRAQCAATTADWTRAFESLTNAASIAPDSPAPLVIGAALADATGDRRRAARLAAEAAQRHFLDSDAALLLARHLWRLGARSLALSWALRAMQLGPENARAKRFVDEISKEFTLE
jgi:tetratricopeptide (TPR) repeat protein